MRMSDEEYFRSCVAKERRLAQLLGRHDIEEFYENAGTLWEGAHALPQWTRDWSACGALIAEYEIPISYHPEAGAVSAGSVNVSFSDHPSREQAIRFAVVKAVIALLEHRAHHGGH